MTRKSHCSRDATAPELCQPPRHSKNSSPPQEGGEAPKGACQPCAAQHQQTSPLVDVPQTSVRSLRHPSATRLRAIRGALAFRRFDRGSRRDSHPCSAPGHASWDWHRADPEKWIPVFRKDHAQLKKPAGVTRPILSQSSDSTSRLGRSAEGNDAQSRPGAGCKPARRHRTRSASESALAKASLDERDDLAYLI